MVSINFFKNIKKNSRYFFGNDIKLVRKLYGYLINKLKK